MAITPKPRKRKRKIGRPAGSFRPKPKLGISLVSRRAALAKKKKTLG